MKKKYHLRLVDNFGNSEHKNKDYLKSQRDTKATIKTSTVFAKFWHLIIYRIHVMCYPIVDQYSA